MKVADHLLIGIAAALLGGTALAADDTLKAGKWEFVTEVHGPKAPTIPPGAKLPPGVQMRPDGSMSVTRTVCVTAQNPVPVGPPQLQQGQSQPNCKLDKMDRSGGDTHWAMTCSGPQGSSHAEGEAHYRGDTMQASTQSHFAAPNQPAADVTEQTSGRYLGACTGNETRPGPAQPPRQAPRS